MKVKLILVSNVADLWSFASSAALENRAYAMLETGAIILSIVTSFTPLVEINEIKRSGTVLERNCLSYVSMWVCYALWAIYGIFLGNFIPIAITNIWGVILSTYYCYVFVKFVRPNERRRVVITYFFGILCTLITSFYCFSGVHPRSIVEARVGSVASFVSILMMASPLSLIPDVLMHGTHLLSFPVIIMYNVTSAVWCIYGILLHDNYISVTNLIGGIVSFASLALFACIPAFYKQVDGE